MIYLVRRTVDGQVVDCGSENDLGTAFHRAETLTPDDGRFRQWKRASAMTWILTAAETMTSDPVRTGTWVSQVPSGTEEEL